MKFFVIAVFSLFMLYGCAQICEFGKTSDTSGVKCIGFLAQAKVGMSQKEVKERIGYPSGRNVDVQYRGKRYDEAWVYDTTPPTILYFKNGILEHKDYQQ